MMIKKISLLIGKTEVVYEKYNDLGRKEEFKISSQDMPDNDFVESVMDLKPHVLNALEMDYLNFGSIDIQTIAKDERQANFTCVVRLKNYKSSIKIKTPKIDLFTLPEDFIEKLSAVELEARKFVNGKRAQQEMWV